MLTKEATIMTHEKPFLRVENISKILGGKEILKSVSLSLKKGELKVLIGPSGAGKSTLLQCINFLLPPDSGRVWLDGVEIQNRRKRDLYAFRRQVGMIFQDFNLFDHLNALDNVAIALRKVKKMRRFEARDRAMAELERVGLENKINLYPAELSGGQKQRVSIARALAMDPKIMLLDEPTSALDPELIGEVLSVIRDLAHGGMTMILATHQIAFTRSLANEVIFLENGIILEQGTPAELLSPDACTRSKDFCSRLDDLYKEKE
jgi:polar amino acid transport system ATP-binding protein